MGASRNTARARHVLLILVFSMLLLSPVAMWVVEKMGATPPSWLTSEDAAYLEGKEPMSQFPELAGIEGFQSGYAQGVLQQYVESFVPMRGVALLADAGLERTFIAFSNSLFKWSCYPTYYGSTVLYAPSMDKLSPFPAKLTGGGGLEAYRVKYQGFFDGLKKVASDFPDTNFYVYIVDDSKGSRFNVAHSLVSFTETMEDIAACFEAELDSLQNVFVQYDDFTSLEDCYARRYDSDMHWNAYGALKAYNQLAGISKMDPYPEDLGYSFVASFYGGAARSGRMLVPSEGQAYDLDFSDLGLVREDGGIDAGGQHAEYYEADEKMRAMNWYETYYGSYGSSPEIEGLGEGNALIVTDSYGAGIKRYIAKQYETTQVRWNLAGKSHPETLAEFIVDNDIDDVYFIGVESNFATYKDGKEDYFD